jgi:hypothetical protein
MSTTAPSRGSLHKPFATTAAIKIQHANGCWGYTNQVITKQAAAAWAAVSICVCPAW